MSEYQYYEFLAVDRPLNEQEQAEVRALSTRARITATSFTNEYHWGDFRGDPLKMVKRYYDAHLYLANWGTHQVVLRLPRALLDIKVVKRYCVDPYVNVSTTAEHLILDLTSEDEDGDWAEEAEDSLSAIVGVRTELAAGDLRSLYLAWLSAYGTWERDEDAFDDDKEDDLEPPVPAGLCSLTAPQRALADFLRLDADLLAVAAQASPSPAEAKDGPHALAKWIKDLSAADKDALLLQVAQGHGTRSQAELLRRFRGRPEVRGDSRPRRTVADLLDTAAGIRQERERQAEAARTAEEARRAQERALARDKRLDALAGEQETAWRRIDALIDTRRPADYDAAVEVLKDLQTLAARADQPQEFTRGLARLRREHLRKSGLIARLDRAGLGVASTGR